MKPPMTLIPTSTHGEALQCQSRYGQCSHMPLPPHPRDAAAWARFCEEIDERINAMRRAAWPS